MSTVFSVTLSQMLGFFIVMLAGFTGKKTKLLGGNLDRVLSQLLSGIVMPALVFQTFSENFKPQLLAEKSLYLLWGTLVLLAALLISWILTRLFAKETFLKRVYFYSFAIPNLSYMGYSVVNAVFGQEALLDMMVFGTPFQIFIYSVCFPLLSYGDAKVSFKNLLNPMFFMMLLGVICGFFNLPLPSLIKTSVAAVADCMAPIAMLITGFVIAKYNIRELLSGKIFLASIFRLVLIPTLFMLIMNQLSISADIIKITLCTLAMPMGMNTVIFPAASGADTRAGAGMALISNLIGVITIPLMFAIWIG